MLPQQVLHKGLGAGGPESFRWMHQVLRISLISIQLHNNAPILQSLSASKKTGSQNLSPQHQGP